VKMQSYSSLWAVGLSVTSAVIVLSSLLYSGFKLHECEKTIREKQSQLALLNAELRDREASAAKLNCSVQDLRDTQDSLLDFLAKVTDESQLGIVGRDVDWFSVKSALDKLPQGKRKQTMLSAILLAWKDIPFAMGKQSVRLGFDSPRFLAFVLSRNGVYVDNKENERMSETLMRIFKKVDKPEPGDLVFYKGQVGSFGFFYLADGNQASSGIGIGTLQSSDPLQVINLDNINTTDYPLRGYFHVRYPDEDVTDRTIHSKSQHP